jgi:hypothetical protein
MTKVKHQLRDWIEQRLSVLDWNGSRWRPNRHRFWQSEQDDYQDGKYFPQRLHEVLISPTDFRRNADRNEHLIVTLGAEPWCSSNWHDVYYRVWQTTSPLAEPALLLNGKEWAFVADPIHGSVNRTDVLIEYSVSGVEGGFTRPEIRHYELRRGILQWVDPVALSPRDFVAFWLRHPWPESSRWTLEASRPILQEWIQKHKDGISDFVQPTSHCTQQPDLWQLETDAGVTGNERVYFLIRWRPPYHFTMMSVNDHPRPDCTEIDRQADRPLPLFPVQ